ncbi:MAG: 1-acyl-sn-glycerol-3-phosphate acyltransferase [Clostridia bacterium]|nr:1-acyl-sn-glycerol-3-phosphate acyltransferase [Clostridia bacterium]
MTADQTRRSRTFSFLQWLLQPLVCRIFNFRFDRLPQVDGPYLLLCNHNTDFDPVFLTFAAGGPVRYVASEHVMRSGIGGRLLKRYFAPIIHTKGVMGLKSTVEILRALRDGDNVGIFAEGNRSFNGITGSIPPVTGKLAKKTGTALVTYRLEGGYFTQPRWGKTFRRGRLLGHLVHVYSPEQLAEMKPDEVQNAICQDLYEDAYAAQKAAPVAFRGKKPALGMEAALFVCPRCKKIGTLTTDARHIRCSCGFAAAYTEFGNLEEDDGTSRTLTDWDSWQRQVLIDMAEQSDEQEPLFSDAVTAYEIGADHSSISSHKGILTAYRNRVSFDGKELLPEDLSGVAVHSRNTLTVHIGPQAVQYEVKGSDAFCALKYVYLYRITQGKELF